MMTTDQTDVLARKFIHFLETGDVLAGLFTADVFCDLTLPRWRLQAQGLEETGALRRQNHPAPGRVPRWRCDPTPTGFVIEVEERWEQDGEDWYCREMMRADVRGDAIAALSIYCTGDWDADRRAEHRRTVRLLRL